MARFEKDQPPPEEFWTVRERSIARMVNLCELIAKLEASRRRDDRDEEDIKNLEATCLGAASRAVAAINYILSRYVPDAGHFVYRLNDSDPLSVFDKHK